MNHVVSICGSQGCGKSTTIERLHQQHNYTTDSFSTPRFVQAELGYKTLAEVLAQPIEKIKEYQMRILDVKLDRDMKNKTLTQASGAVIVERNFADIYAFAKQWALNTQNADFIDWVDNVYKGLCVDAHNEVDYFAILLTPLKSFEVDPRRASEDNRFDVHDRMFDFLLRDVRDFSREVGNSMMLGVDNLQERVKRINQEIQLRYFFDSPKAKHIMAEAFAPYFAKNKDS